MEATSAKIEEIILSTFKAIDSIYSFRKEGSIDGEKILPSRIIFPRYSVQYRNGKVRVSEQELRFLFVEQLNKYCDVNAWNVYYSVETPTEKRYRFSGSSPCVDENGQSAMVDLSIHDVNGNRICLIEFKAHNPEQFCYAKDLVKLKEECESECLKFFIQILETDNSDVNSRRNTIQSIESKINSTISPNIRYYCHTVNGLTRKNSIQNPCKLVELKK